MSKTLWYLKRCPLFQELRQNEVERLEAHSKIRTIPAKCTIHSPYDVTNAVFLLASGRLKVCHLTDEGKQTLLAFIEPGELFGELSLVDLDHSDERVESVESSTVVCMPGDIIRELMRTHADVSLGITKLIGFRRRRIERRLKQLLFLSNRQRITHLLLELAEQYGTPTSDGVELGIRLSHQDLANIVGSTRETVTVVLGELQLDQLIRVGRQRIRLLNPKALAKSVGRSWSVANYSWSPVGQGEEAGPANRTRIAWNT